MIKVVSNRVLKIMVIKEKLICIYVVVVVMIF